MGGKSGCHDSNTILRIASEIKDLVEHDLQICLVVGGGNIYRGSKASDLGIKRIEGDYIGMMSTVVNGLLVEAALKAKGIKTVTFSSFEIKGVCAGYDYKESLLALESGNVVIFTAGVGAPFFSTDTSAVLKAIEMNCELMLKGTQVEGVYSDNPFLKDDAEFFEHISYEDIIIKNLRIMDMPAISLAKDNNLVIKVFALGQEGNIMKVIKGEGVFTTIS